MNNNSTSAPMIELVTQEAADFSQLSFEYYKTDLGDILLASSSMGICFLSLTSDKNQSFEELHQSFPDALLTQEAPKFQRIVLDICNGKSCSVDSCLILHVKGNDFQINVWRELLKINTGEKSSYKEIAEKLGKPKAYRAVGSAIGRNSIAFLIPCHRVISAGGKISGFRWGIEKKKELLEREDSSLLSFPIA